MDKTQNYAFPLLYSHQAQKEITINEAITAIDGIIAANVGQGKHLAGYTEHVEILEVLGELSLDVALSNVFVLTLTGDLVIDFSGEIEAGKVVSVTLVINQRGYALTLPDTVKWSGENAPELSGMLDVLSFMSYDGGVSWLGFVAGLDMR